MDICSLIGPGTYEWLLRGVRLLAATEIVFDFVGPERLNRTSVKVEDFSKRMGDLRLSERFARLVKAYVKWLWRLADVLVRNSDLISRCLEAYLQRRSSTSRDEERPSPFEEYGWKTNLLLLGLTLGLVLAASHYVVPLLPHAERLSATSMLAIVHERAWPVRVLYSVFVVAPLQGGINGMLVLMVAGVVYGVGLTLEKCLAGFLWGVSRGLHRVSWVLLYPRLRLVARLLALAGIVLPELLPSKPCG